MANRPGSGRKLDNIKYTQVIIIGNGPSAICLSYFLSGNTPFYNGNPVPNEFLESKLKENINVSLLDQDLTYLAEGLEGRSSNPVALLIDILMKPDADLGIESPSALTWVKQEDRAIDHVVLGKGTPGGVWQTMDASMNTLSLGNWMELPDMPFRDWSKEYRSQRNLTTLRNDRASMSEVGQYYLDYIDQKHLKENFLNMHTVTSVQKVLDVDLEVNDESGELEIGAGDAKMAKCIWEVCGKRHVYDPIVGEEVLVEEFCFRAPNVVLATGVYDQPNKLGIPGENLPHVMHSVQDLQHAIQEGSLTSDSDPVIVVGAGLSAADAILHAEDSNLSIVHVFRRDADDNMMIFNKLPKMMYPEYHRVHSMMKGEEPHDLYTAFEAHTIKEFMPSGQVIIQNRHDTCERLLQPSRVLVLIGSKPDLSFLRNDGRSLGFYDDEPIDCKNNPVNIDVFSFESVKESGLFAIGPLIGDNFVRFIQGGGLGVANHLRRKLPSASFKKNHTAVKLSPSKPCSL